MNPTTETTQFFEILEILIDALVKITFESFQITHGKNGKLGSFHQKLL